MPYPNLHPSLHPSNLIAEGIKLREGRMGVWTGQGSKETSLWQMGSAAKVVTCELQIHMTLQEVVRLVAFCCPILLHTGTLATAELCSHIRKEASP